MKTLNFFLTFILIVKYGIYTTDECDKIQNRIDDNLKKILWVGESKIPRTDNEMDKFCLDISSLLKESIIYKNCLTPFPKIILSVFIRQIKKLSKSICSNRIKKQESLKRLTCLNENNVQYFHNCTEKAFVQLNYLSQNFENSEVLPGFCCLLISTSQCTKKSFKVIRETCKSSKQSPLTSVLNGLSGEASDLLCSKYKTKGVCEKEFSTKQRKIEEYLINNKLTFKDIPIIKPLLLLANKVSDKE